MKTVWNQQMRERIIELQQAAATAPGKIILDHLKAITGADRSGYRPNPHDLAYAAGLRDVWCLINEELNIDVQKMDKFSSQRENNMEDF
ncbi:MAG: hypothetical protein PHI35_03285 [Victivallaceae bacterium]|nr:hypothetical protein [Victivallaceae bacterium]